MSPVSGPNLSRHDAKRVAVIGAGNWGTALSLTLANLGHSVRIWAYEKEVVESIRRCRENELFMPGVYLPENIVPTTDLAEALERAEYLLTVMPSHVCRSLYEQMLPYLYPETILVSATKGIESSRLMRMSEVIRSVVAEKFVPRLAVLSGPSFAKEVAQGDPTAVVVASEDRDAAQAVQRTLSSRTLRLYTSNDVIGVELGGAVKNVIAIAAGVIKGLGLGNNPTAALITRGLAEITRLACASGGKRETLAGLAGMGDLVLTCTGELSRNRSVGVRLGKGQKLPEIVGSMRMVAEGVKTTGATVALADREGVEMPITRQVQRILEGGISPLDAIRELMERTLKDE
ncbi:MAG TPA: NAD(P)H-dependent glycerol-3-phosphate dehydrogenase [Acidobacteriota bacterium]|nr:NAD(P)H-dependent glycerol-3-phosphate dehydrogenase [Acidobacteriota bacterium]